MSNEMETIIRRKVAERSRNRCQSHGVIERERKVLAKEIDTLDSYLAVDLMNDEADEVTRNMNDINKCHNLISPTVFI